MCLPLSFDNRDDYVDECIDDRRGINAVGEVHELLSFIGNVVM